MNALLDRVLNSIDVAKGLGSSRIYVGPAVLPDVEDWYHMRVADGPRTTTAHDLESELQRLGYTVTPRLAMGRPTMRVEW